MSCMMAMRASEHQPMSTLVLMCILVLKGLSSYKDGK